MKASRRDAQPAPARSCSKGFGGAATNKQNERPAGAGRSVFAQWDHRALLATMVKARKEREIPALFSGCYQNYNGREPD